MAKTQQEYPKFRYPLWMRLIHWLRAVLILCLLLSGGVMTRLPEDTPMSIFDALYHNHKQFGILVWLIALVHLFIRWKHSDLLPPPSKGLKVWEQTLSKTVHRSIIALTISVPMMGYAMSASYTQSSGVPFFFLDHLPEILPKNDAAFNVYNRLHAYLAYSLLGLVLLHMAGALKHRRADKEGEIDVLSRMI